MLGEKGNSEELMEFEGVVFEEIPVKVKMV